MDIDAFRALVESLTGTPVKDLCDRDTDFLSEILKHDEQIIDCSQLNELLLLVNKDRLGWPFFKYFFQPPCSLSVLSAGVERFQKMALRRYGNFIHAYRKLSRITTDAALLDELNDCAKQPASLISDYEARTQKLIEIDLIKREDTPLVGYLSAGEIIAENARAKHLRNQLPLNGEQATSDWAAYEEAVISEVIANDEQVPLRKIIANYRTANQGTTVAEFGGYLDATIPLLGARFERLNKVRNIATRNQDVYLTWDHMDVYFATSMRKRWEFEDLFDFVAELMGHEDLTSLNVRYFDPTQSYTADRINKGLVESLMLKRAKCTVYSVQDTDTLGKDSELAATLAQGKPVIAYVPRINVEERVNILLTEEPVTIQDRLRFVIYADEYFAASLSVEDREFVRDFHDLERFEQNRIWRSVPDEASITAFRQKNHGDLKRLCGIIAISEERIYEKRASTLTKTHPLAVQVNLETGVANGVLVVRSVSDCAKLLRRVLTNAMEFDLQEDKKAEMWYLRETISGCVFRVVSKDRKLTNCFWNFYLRS